MGQPVLTNAGLTLLSTAIQTNGASVAITYVSVGTGAATLTAALSNGTNYTSIATTALAVNLSAGQLLTIFDGLGNVQSVTVASPGASIGANSVPVNSFTAAVNLAIGAGVVTTPALTDIAMNAESYRLATTPGVAGANPGESLSPGYFDPSVAPTALYLEVGYWAGSTAGAGLGTGTLFARDFLFWNHTQNVDSANCQADITL